LTKLSVPKITRRWWYEVFVIEYWQNDADIRKPK
jgi:hypothetical protein